MIFVFEISQPFQWRPGFFRTRGVTSWRVVWGWFALSCHPMRLDELVDGAARGVYQWRYGKEEK